MPRRATIRIILATLVGLALWIPASSANAADDPCCSMQVSGLPTSFQAGADPQVFGATINVTQPADPKNSMRYIAATFGVQAGNLTGSQVHFAWKQQFGNGSWHSVGFSRKNGMLVATFYPYQNAPNAGQVNLALRLSFTDKVASQNMQVAMALLGAARKSDAKELAQAGPYASAVLGKAVVVPPPTQAPVTLAPTPTPTPTATDSTAAATTPEDTSTTDAGVVPAVAASDSGGGSGIWIFYIIGGLLLLAGIGVIGTLLWKRNSTGAPEWPDPNDPSLYGDQPAPAYPASPYPTTAYPQPTAYPPQAPYPTTAYPQQVRPPTDPTRQMPGL